MDRQKLVELAYQRGTELNLNNKNYLRWLEKYFDEEYRGDVGSGDITSEAILLKNNYGKAVLTAKQSGIVGGAAEVIWFCRKHGVEAKNTTEDAKQIFKGDTILEIYGKQRDILATERICLNVLQRMSGIATETCHLSDMIRGYKTRIAATRKTPLRFLDKKAVFLGGGLTHRFGLWDSILIKDNHLKALKNGGIKKYVEKAIARASISVDRIGFLEIETSNLNETMRAARKFKQLKLNKPCIIMLDNVRPMEIEETIEKLRSSNLFNCVLLEASGNINRENIRKYAKTGIDVISMGYLTHSTKILDMSLEMIT